MTGTSTPNPPGKSHTQRNGVAAHWDQRMRLNALQAFRYTRFVTVMRRLLPVGAIAILGVVMVYAFLPRDKDRMSLTYEHAGDVDGTLSMNRPRLTGTDASGNPYAIAADLAVQDSKNSHRVSLIKVDASFHFDGARWANAKAGKGFVDMDEKTMRLSDAIDVVTDDGYRLRTERASADLNRNIVFGDTRVVGTGPLGTIEADTFLIDRDKRHVTLKGHVHTKLYPKKVKR